MIDGEIDMRRVFTILAILMATPLWAQDRPDGWSIGGFATIGQSIYLGESASAAAVPNVSYKSGDWTFGVAGITRQFYESGPSKVDLHLKPRFFGLVSADAPELDGIDRNITADIGANWTYTLSQATSFEVEVLQDITDAHNGQEIAFGIEQKVTLGPVPLWMGGTLTWQSDGLSNYLYGVSASEATGSRAAYSPGPVLIPSLSVTSGFPINNRAFLFGSLRYEMLPDEVTASPIVARDGALSLVTGISYAF